VKNKDKEVCAICGCDLHRTKNTYAKPTILGRSHATKHHYVAERFFGRSCNRKGTIRTPIFTICPWKLEQVTEVFCYDCHEELLHNPVFLPENIRVLASIAKQCGATESQKTKSKEKLGKRIQILQEAISIGLNMMNAEKKQYDT